MKIKFRKSVAKLSVGLLLLTVFGFTLLQVMSIKADVGPKVIEAFPMLSGDGWSKRVIVYHNDTQHYYNTSVEVPIPENLQDVALYRYTSDTSMRKVSNDPLYQFALRDVDGNGRTDAAAWVVPQLSEVSFSIEGNLVDLTTTTTAGIELQATVSTQEVTTVPEVQGSEGQGLVEGQGMETQGSKMGLPGKEGKDIGGGVSQFGLMDTGVGPGFNPSSKAYWRPINWSYSTGATNPENAIDYRYNDTITSASITAPTSTRWINYTFDLPDGIQSATLFYTWDNTYTDGSYDVAIFNSTSNSFNTLWTLSVSKNVQTNSTALNTSSGWVNSTGGVLVRFQETTDVAGNLFKIYDTYIETAGSTYDYSSFLYENEIVAGFDYSLDNETKIYDNKTGGWVGTNASIDLTTALSVAVGDADNDGQNEIVAGFGSGAVSEVKIYDNQSGGWVQTDVSGDKTNAYAVAIGDADNDGQNEIVVGYGLSPSNEVKIYDNQSGGWVETNVGATGGAGVRSVAIGDADNDGQNEIVSGNSLRVDSQVLIYDNKTGGWTKTNVGTTTTDNYAYEVAIGDADNDGQNEIVVGFDNAATGGEVKIYNNVSGAWSQSDVSGNLGDDVFSVAIGDADNDGLNEIVTGCDVSVTNETKIYDNKTGGWAETNVSGDLGLVNSVAIGDADNDGQNEIVAGFGTGLANRTKIYDNKTGGWAETNVSGDLTTTLSVAVGDADNEFSRPANISFTYGLDCPNATCAFNGMFPFSDARYNATRFSDNYRAKTNATAQIFNFKVNESTANIASLTVRYEGVGGGLNLWIWNGSEYSNITSSRTIAGSGTVDNLYYFQTSDNIANYIDGAGYVHVKVNDSLARPNITTDYIVLDLTPGRALEVNLTNPDPGVHSAANPKVVDKYQTFVVNATVKCLTNHTSYGNSCGQVNGYLYYNNSLVNTTVGGSPFYMVDPVDGKAIWSYKSAELGVPYGVAVDSNDNVIVVGQTISPVTWNVTKWTKDGVIIWKYQFLGGVHAKNVAVDSNDNVIVVGYAPDDWNVTKLNSAGTIMWSYNWTGGNIAYDVAVDSNDNVIVVGSTDSSDWNVTKLNSAGVIIWTYSYSVGNTARGVAVDSQDNVIVVGGTDAPASWNITKLNNNGVAIWSQNYSGGGAALAYDVAVDSRDNVIVVGDTSASGTWNVTKLSPSGKMEWSYTYSVTNSPYGVAVDSQDNVIVIGNNAVSNIWNVTKLRSDGTVTWSYLYSAGTTASGVAVDSNDNVIVVGSDGTTYWNITKLSGNNNPKSCGTLQDGESCQLNWTVNATGLRNRAYNFTVVFNATNTETVTNATESAWLFTKPSRLLVNLTTPDPLVYTAANPKSVKKNQAFTVNATANCTEDNCSVVRGYLFYNNSLVNSSTGEPFYIVEPVDGKVLWSQECTDGYTAYGVAVDSQDNIIVVGNHGPITNHDWNVTKMTKDGVKIWSYNYTVGDTALGVAVDGNDNVIVVGSTDTPSDWNVTKLNSAGVIQWSYNYTVGFSAFGVATDSNNNIIVVGSSGSGVTDFDWNVTKLTAGGVVIWSYNYSVGDIALGVATDSNDNVIVVGSTGPFNVYDWNVTKLTAGGVVIWSYNYSVGRTAYGVAVDSQDNVIVVGSTDSPIAWNVTKLTPGGVVIWSYNYTDGGAARGVAVDSQDNVIVVGTVGNNPYDWNVTKLTPGGVVIWSYNYTVGNAAYGVAVDSQDNVIVVGETDGNDWNVTKLSGNNNPKSCGNMLNNSRCQLNWTVNATVDGVKRTFSVKFNSSSSETRTNTTGAAWVDVEPKRLEVNLTNPYSGTYTVSNPKVVAKNNFFVVNTTVTCRGGYCGTVKGDLFYNGTRLNTTVGDRPFYVVDPVDGKVLWSYLHAGGTDAWDVAVDSNDNVIVVGRDDTNIWNVTKLYSNGTVIWSYVWNIGTVPYGVAVDSQDNVIVGGYSVGIGMNVTKLTAGGVKIWSYVYDNGNTEARGIAVDSDDNVTVVGSDSTNVWNVTKLTPGGVVIWSYIWNGGTEAYDVATDSNDNMVVVGGTLGGAVGTNDWNVTKLNSAGVIQWSYNYTGGAEAYDVAVDSQDNVIVVGYTDSNDWNVTKLSSAGVVQWSQNYSVGKAAHGVAVDSQDNVIVVGSTDEYDWNVTKLTKDGKMIWSQNYTDGSEPMAVATDSQDNVIVVGYTSVPNDWNVTKLTGNSNSISCGIMQDGDICQLNWTINATGLKNRKYNFTVNFTTSEADADYNTTSGAWVEIEPNRLLVNLVNPDPLVYTEASPKSQAQNTTFVVNATVNCTNGNCNIVKGFLFSNNSLVNTTVGGSPFYVVDPVDGKILWSYSYSVGLYAYGVAVDSQDNVIVVGNTNNPTAWNVTKMTKDGVKIWSYNYTGGASAYGVAVDSQDNVIVVGTTDGNDWNVTKLSSAGVVQWSYNYTDGLYAYGVAVDSQDNVIVVGMTDTSDWNVTKLSSAGVVQWSYVDTDGFYAYGVAVDSQDSVIVVGTADTSDWNVTKLSSAGVVQWSYLYSVGNTAFDVAVDSQDSVIVVGYTDDSDWNVTKLTAGGVKIWSYNYSVGNIAWAVAVDSQDNVIVVGDTDDSDWNVTKLTSGGVKIWSYNYTGGASAYGVAVDSQDNVIVVGTTDGNDWNVTKLSGNNNPNSCGNLLNNSMCQLNWTVNATGSIDTAYNFTVKFNSSSSETKTNTTAAAWLKIAYGTVTFSNNATNATIAGTAVNFSLNVSYGANLDSTAGYIFSTNNTGSWFNASYVAYLITSTIQKVWNVTRLNNTIGAFVQWLFYANSTTGAWSVSDTYNLTANSQGYLEVNLTTPDPAVYTSSNTLKVGQNRTFVINATAICRNSTGECGSVYGYARYKERLDVPWWNSSWPYRRQIVVTEINGTDVANWTTNFTLDTTGLISAGKMWANMSDVRIVDNQTELAYHVEPYTNNTAGTIIHFKLNLTANQNKTTVYMYYGNFSFATPNYNLNDVYLWWDDFNRANNANISTTPNYTHVGNGRWNITNNMLVYNGSTTDPNKLMIVNLSNDPLYKDAVVVVKARALRADGGMWNVSRFGPSMRMDGVGGTGRGYSAIFHTKDNLTAVANAERKFGFLNEWVGWATLPSGGKSADLNWNLSVWYWQKFMMINQSGWFKIWNDTKPEPIAWNYSNISMESAGAGLRYTGYLGLAGSNNHTDVIQFDDLHIFRAMANEPTYLYGDEQTEQVMTEINSTTEGLPFHTVGSNLQSCGFMQKGSQCQLNWTVNATGDWHTKWLMDARFNSTYALVFNDTNDAGVEIVDPVPPRWTEFGANNSAPEAGQAVLFYSTWWDESDLKAGVYVFSWNASGANCDTWQNDSSLAFQTGNWTNTTKTIPEKCANRTIGYEFFAKDNDGNWNKTNTSVLDTAALIDTKSPQWFNWGANSTRVQAGKDIFAFANWTENVSLDNYVFSWNASGSCDTWSNDTAVAFGNTTWSNLTKTIPHLCGGKKIAIKIFAMDSHNNWNATNFTILTVNYSYSNIEASLTNPDPLVYSEDRPKSIKQNRTFSVNSSATCSGEAGDICGNVTGSVRYGKPWTFIVANGTNLTLNGENYFFAGGNAYYLWFRPNSVVDEVLEDMKAMNITVVRTWGFCDGSTCDTQTGGYAFQTSAGVYKTATFQKFDYVINKSRSLGIRLVIPLVNNWNEWGGMQQYVDWSPTASSHDQFFNDSNSKQYYKDYVSYFLNWQNSITGLKYKDDPTILGWELANEARAQSNTTGILVKEWYDEMSTYVRSIDNNHLITTGEEGWWGSEGEGTNFTKNCLLGNISYCSYHYLGDQWGSWGAGWTYSQSRAWITGHINMSHNSSIRKPAVVGELAKNESGRDGNFTAWYNSIETLNGNGDIFWHLLYDEQSGDTYALYYPENASTADIITKHANTTNDKANITARPVLPSGTPFFTLDSNPQTCNILSSNQPCLFNWTLNASGTIGYNWTIDVLYTSNETAVSFNATNRSGIGIVNKNDSLIKLYLNGSEAGMTYVQTHEANITTVVNVSGKNINLDSNITGWVQQTGTGSVVINYTRLMTHGYHSFTGEFTGDANFSESSQTYYATVQPMIDIHREQVNATGLGRNATVRLIVRNRGLLDANGVNLTDSNATGWQIFAGSCSPACSINRGNISWELGTIPVGNFTQVSYIVNSSATEATGTFKANATYKVSSLYDSVQDEDFAVHAIAGRAYFEMELDVDNSTADVEREMMIEKEYNVTLAVKNVGDEIPPERVYVELKVNKTQFNTTCPECGYFVEADFYYLEWNKSTWAVGETKVFNFTLNSSVTGYHTIYGNVTYDPPAGGAVTSLMSIMADVKEQKESSLLDALSDSLNGLTETIGTGIEGIKDYLAGLKDSGLKMTGLIALDEPSMIGIGVAAILCIFVYLLVLRKGFAGRASILSVLRKRFGKEESFAEKPGEIPAETIKEQTQLIKPVEAETELQAGQRAEAERTIEAEQTVQAEPTIEIKQIVQEKVEPVPQAEPVTDSSKPVDNIERLDEELGHEKLVQLKAREGVTTANNLRRKSLGEMIDEAIKSNGKGFATAGMILLLLFSLAFVSAYSIAMGKEAFGPVIEYDAILYGNRWSKRIEVNNQLTGYYNISIGIPERLAEIELYKFVSATSMRRVTDSVYNLRMKDSDGDSLNDTVEWTVPPLTESDFSLEGRIIEPAPLATKLTAFPTSNLPISFAVQEDDELTIEQNVWKSGLESQGARVEIVKPVDPKQKHKAIIEKAGIKVEFENLENAEWGREVEVTEGINRTAMRKFLSGKELEDFVWIESNGFLEGDYKGSITLPGVYKTVFVCEGTEGNPDCFAIQECGERPCYEIKDGKTVVLLDHFSGAGGADLTIIDVQSYPVLYGNWTVRFNTTGTADLTIRAVDGTEFDRDIEFLELRCGDEALTKELTDGVVFVKNYTCGGNGYETSKVLMGGKHTLEFRFGDDVEYAYNQAIVEYPILYDSIEGGWTNSTGSNPDTLNCATIGNFTGCGSEGSDYQAGADSGNVYAGTYSLCMEDWDTLNTAAGIWYTFNPSTACGGATCDYINLTYAFNSVSMDAGEFCRVLGDDDTVTARILWTCVANCTTTYASYTVNLSRALDHTDTSWDIRFVQDASGADDECWWDNFYIAGYKTRKGTSISLWINDTEANYETIYGASVNATAKINTTGLPVTILINGTIIGNGPTRGVSILNASNLANATYNITANFTGNASHDGSIAQYLVRVRKADVAVNLTLNGTDGSILQAYPAAVNATGWRNTTLDNVGNISLWRNGTIIASRLNDATLMVNQDLLLGNATYNYTLTFNNVTNYTVASVVNRYYRVEKGAVTLNLLLNDTAGDVSQIYPSAVNATGWNSTAFHMQSAYNISLWRNGTIKNSIISGAKVTEGIVLANSTYNYTISLNSSNYTAAIVQRLYRMNKGDPQVLLVLNGTQANREYNFGEVANLTAWLLENNANVTIYSNYTGSLQNITPKTEGRATNLTYTSRLTEARYIILANATGDGNWTNNATGANYTMTVVIKPQYFDNATQYANGSQYVPTKSWGFQARFTDTAVSKAFIEANFNTSGATNFTAYCTGAATNRVCVANFTDVAAGTYGYRWYVNDSFNSWNSTANQTFTIIRNTSAAISLWLNDTAGNRSYTQYQKANLTASLNISGQRIYLTSNMTGFVEQSGSNSVIFNITNFTSFGYMNITAFFNSSNYTERSATYFATVVSKIWVTNLEDFEIRVLEPSIPTVAHLEVLLVTPNPSVSTTVQQETTFIVNATVFCRGIGNCGSVNGTLQYNITGTDPNEEINNSAGSRPFYHLNASTLIKCRGGALMNIDDYCNVSWTVNAMGDEADYKIGVKFNSSSGSIATNHTDNATIHITPNLLEIWREQPNATGLNKDFQVRLVVYNKIAPMKDVSSVNLTDWNSSANGWVIVNCTACTINSGNVTWQLGDIPAGNFSMVNYTVRSPGIATTGKFKANATYEYSGIQTRQGDEYNVETVANRAFFDTELDLDNSTAEIERIIPNGTTRTARLSVTNVGDLDAPDVVYIVMKYNGTAFNVSDLSGNGLHYQCGGDFNCTEWTEEYFAAGETKSYTFKVNTSFVNITANFSTNVTYDPPGRGNTISSVEEHVVFSPDPQLQKARKISGFAALNPVGIAPLPFAIITLITVTAMKMRQKRERKERFKVLKQIIADAVGNKKAAVRSSLLILAVASLLACTILISMTAKGDLSVSSSVSGIVIENSYYKVNVTNSSGGQIGHLYIKDGVNDNYDVVVQEKWQMGWNEYGDQYPAQQSVIGQTDGTINVSLVYNDSNVAIVDSNGTIGKFTHYQRWVFWADKPYFYIYSRKTWNQDAYVQDPSLDFIFKSDWVSSSYSLNHTGTITNVSRGSNSDNLVYTPNRTSMPWVWMGNRTWDNGIGVIVLNMHPFTDSNTYDNNVYTTAQSTYSEIEFTWGHYYGFDSVKSSGLSEVFEGLVYVTAGGNYTNVSSLAQAIYPNYTSYTDMGRRPGHGGASIITVSNTNPASSYFRGLTNSSFYKDLLMKSNLIFKNTTSTINLNFYEINMSHVKEFNSTYLRYNNYTKVGNQFGMNLTIEYFRDSDKTRWSGYFETLQSINATQVYFIFTPNNLYTPTSFTYDSNGVTYVYEDPIYGNQSISVLNQTPFATKDETLTYARRWMVFSGTNQNISANTQYNFDLYFEASKSLAYDPTLNNIGHTQPIPKFYAKHPLISSTPFGFCDIENITSANFSNNRLTLGVYAGGINGTVKVYTSNYTPAYILNASYNMTRNFDSANRVLSFNVNHSSHKTIAILFKNATYDPLNGAEIKYVDSGVEVLSVSYDNTTKQLNFTVNGTGTGKAIELTYNLTKNFDLRDNNYVFASVRNGYSFNANSSYQFSYDYPTGRARFVLPVMSEHDLGMDPESSQWTFNSTAYSSGAGYVQDRNFGFQIIWSDLQSNLDNVTFETNITTGGALENITKNDATKHSGFGNNSNGVWWVNFTAERTKGAAKYFFRWFANDTDGNWNASDQWEYNISKGVPLVSLWLNGTADNRSYFQSRVANFTVSVNVSGQNVFIATNITNFETVKGTNAFLQNITTLPETGVINVTAFFNVSSDWNYTASTQTYYATVLSKFFVTNFEDHFVKSSFIPTSPYLEVLLVTPSGPTTIQMNTTFTVNATVFCMGIGGCSGVNGTLMHNTTMTETDEPVNNSAGSRPFYHLNASNPIQCLYGAMMNSGDYCNVSWIVNATGDLADYMIGVKFNSSDQTIKVNYTTNQTITITGEAEQIAIWSPANISFGNVNPNTLASSNPAVNNANKLYNITNRGTVAMQIWIKGTDLYNETFRKNITVANMTWTNVSSTYSSANCKNMSYEYQSVNRSLPINNANVTTYYWLSVPPIYAGRYNGTIWICGNKTTAGASQC